MKTLILKHFFYCLTLILIGAPDPWQTKPKKVRGCRNSL